MTATFVFEGLPEFEEKLKELAPLYKDATALAMVHWSMDVMGESQKNYVPVDTGALKGSPVEGVTGYKDDGGAFLEDARENGGNIELTMGYSRKYAFAVHENLAARHEVGQAKYLEIPMLLKSMELTERIAKYCTKAAEEKL